jgi:hypothetical protein
MERVDLRDRARAREIASVAIEDSAENDVEASDEPEQCDADSDTHDKHQPTPQSEASHPIR